MNEIIKIHPAILVDNLKDFLIQINKASEYADQVDVDIIDWERTKNKTILVQEALSIPDNISMNFDLMMDYPSEVIKILIKDKRVNTIILNVIQKENFNELIEIIKEGGKKVGIALNPENKVEELDEYLNIIDHIQIYAVEPGKQNNPFLEKMLKKSLKLKKMGFMGTIGFDGGINQKTILKIKKYPVDYLSVGSELSQAENSSEVYNILLNLIK